MHRSYPDQYQVLLRHLSLRTDRHAPRVRPQVAAAVQRVHRVSAGRHHIELITAIRGAKGGAADLPGNPHRDARRAVAAIGLEHPADDAAERLQADRDARRAADRHPAGSSAT